MAGKSTKGRKAASKAAARKAAGKKSAAKKSVAKKSAAKKSIAKKSIAKKSATKKSSGAKKNIGKKTSSKKSASRKSLARKSLARKSPAGKGSVTKAARKGAKKKSSAGKSAGGKIIGSSQAIGRVAALPRKSPARSASTRLAPLRKTARSRLAKRSGHESVAPARKIALRTSLSRRVPAKRKPRDSGAGVAFVFEPSFLCFREATRQDWPAIRRIHIEAFGRIEESQLVERLRASRDLVAEYVAEYNGRPVAHVAFSALNVSIDGRPVRAAGLAPVAVTGELERHGIATRLVIFALENIRGSGHDAAFVVGRPEFYRRFGFSSRIAERFASPYAGPASQALEFEPGALRGERGESEWPEAFSTL